MRHLLAPLLGMLLALPVARGMPAPTRRRDASAAAPTTTWMAILLEGRKIGSLRVDRAYRDGTVTTTQTLSIELSRARQPLHFGSMSRTVESRSGEPLDFSASSSVSSIESTVRARRIAARRFLVTTQTGGVSRRREIRLDPDVLLFEGQRQAMMAAPHGRGAAIACASSIRPASRSRRRHRGYRRRRPCTSLTGR